MAGRRSRNKGKAGEREAAAALTAAFGVVFNRTAQHKGNATGDVEGLEGIHVEVKRWKAIAAIGFYDQATKDAKEGEVPIVMMRQDGDKRWVIMLDVQDLPHISRLIHRREIQE